ncbi:MAG: DUF2255 family protein [Streptosporangiaceae bacterium]
MTGWTPAELHRIGSAEELQIITGRRDGSDRPPVPIWVVRVGDELYVRSFRGPDGAWYRHASQHPAGRIRAGGIDRAVTFDAAGRDGEVRPAVDDAYRAKYARYGDSYLGPMLAEQAAATTLKLTPSS